MASIAAAEEERRARIISHMNRAHTRELAHYLRHYAGASSRDASNPSLRDLTLQGMRIRAAGNDYAVPFAPPLDDWNDVKQRIIDMDSTARKHLGISDVFLTKYLLPRPFDCFVLGAVLFYFGCVATLPWPPPATTTSNIIDAIFPGGVEWYRWLTRTLLLPVIACHAIETFLFDRKLRRHGVNRWTGLWWLWASSCFVEGIMAFRRVDDHIAQKRAAMEGKSQ
ncbi:hypothetical protein OCS_03652 [Ophiocordyceps sinensis CO18]|uniref:DUF2470 domain-containing protein n=1 Tax=Ophiocordyceps sinensis (strain Co18 / CGMCC 3.14243) TaxID=911162 RepID=T5A5B7_OPHSC|nr:hypothetical protein OCS_03652 [Ophiocordyceps sinensis CO18]